MLVVYKVTAALLSLTLVSVIIYESLYGRDLNDEGLKLRRRSFAAFYFLYLISTAFRYFSISDHGIELIPIRVMSMDIITSVVVALLIAAYFGRWYYKHFYSWFFSLLLPVLIFIFANVIHYTAYYHPVYSYHEVFSISSVSEIRLVQVAVLVIIGLLVLYYLAFFVLICLAYRYNRRRRQRVTTLVGEQRFHERRDLLLFVFIVTCTFCSNFIGSLAFDIFCNVGMMAIVLLSVRVYTEFVRCVRMKHKGSLVPAAIRQEIQQLSFHSPSPLFAGNPTLEEVAEQLNVSRDELSDYIYQTRHMSFSQWLSFCRLELCAYLLEATDRSISDIAAEAGYSTLPSMYRAFKAAYDMTPAEYRSKKRSEVPFEGGNQP